jgi:hypothetical protein
MAPPPATGKQGQPGTGINERNVRVLRVYAGICLSAPKPDAEICDKIDAVSLVVIFGSITGFITAFETMIMFTTGRTLVFHNIFKHVNGDLGEFAFGRVLIIKTSRGYNAFLLLLFFGRTKKSNAPHGYAHNAASKTQVTLSAAVIAFDKQEQ